MIRLTTLSRAVAVAASLAVTTTAFAGAPGEPAVTETPAAVSTTTTEAKTETPFTASINIGPAIGYADRSSGGGDFGWGIHALARLFRYGGIQLEYWSLGNAHNPSGGGSNTGNGGHFDGLYVGVMPMYPIFDDFNVYAQVGGAFCDEGNDVAAGGGILYGLPIDWLHKNHVDLDLQLDYKYFNIEAQGDRGQHLLTFGFLVGFHKVK